MNCDVRAIKAASATKSASQNRGMMDGRRNSALSTRSVLIADGKPACVQSFLCSK